MIGRCTNIRVAFPFVCSFTRKISTKTPNGGFSFLCINLEFFFCFCFLATPCAHIKHIGEPVWPYPKTDWLINERPTYFWLISRGFARTHRRTGFKNKQASCCEAADWFICVDWGSGGDDQARKSESEAMGATEHAHSHLCHQLGHCRFSLYIFEDKAVWKLYSHTHTQTISFCIYTCKFFFFSILEVTSRYGLCISK